jgi:hypothetical protein
MSCAEAQARSLPASLAGEGVAGGDGAAFAIENKLPIAVERLATPPSPECNPRGGS